MRVDVLCGRPLGGHAPAILRRGVEYSVPPAGALFLDHALQGPRGLGAAPGQWVAVRAGGEAVAGPIFAELEDRGDVAAAVAVVGGRPDGHDGRVEHFLEPFHD